MDHRIVEKEIERRNAEFNYLQKKKAEELKEKRKSRHDWHLAFFNVFGGAIAGGIVSLAFWLVEHYC